MTASNFILLGRTMEALRPGASWQSNGETYADIVWLDPVQIKPTQDEFNVEFAHQQTLDGPPPPNWVLTQDLIAQLTTTDITTIQSSIASNPTNALLWYALLGQRDPMNVNNARFKAGWAALVSVLGQPRMTAIAQAIGITIS